MRISDWSSDVCSSDLLDTVAAEPGHLETLALQLLGDNDFIVDEEVRIHLQTTDLEVQPGSGERHRDCEQLLRNGRDPFDDPEPIRSEEHTSEIQSLMLIPYAVFCLKKNKRIQDSKSS